MPTIFEKIIAGEIPADIVYQDEHVVAFRDVQPQAPVHLLIVPRMPIARLRDADAGDVEMLGHLFLAAEKVARSEGVADSGYRLVLNDGEQAGQVVPHLHVHLLAGRGLRWPPG